MEPRTEAGRRLLDGFGPMPRPDAQELHRRSAMGRRVKLQAAILAIEEEARTVNPEGRSTDEDGLRAALEPFAKAAANEASRTHLEDGYIIGPNGLTVADWRRLDAALSSATGSPKELPPHPDDANARALIPAREAIKAGSPKELEAAPSGADAAASELREALRGMGVPEIGGHDLVTRIDVLSILRAALTTMADPYPHDPVDDPAECSECKAQERLLGADQSEEWVADRWSLSTPHPSRTPTDG